MDRTFDLLIDIANVRTNKICLKRGDKGATIQFTLMNNNVVLDMSDARIVTIKGVKPDDTIIYADATIVTDSSGNNTNVVTYAMSDEACTTAGLSTYELTIQDANMDVITTFNFYISVDNLLFDEEDYESKDDTSGFRSYMIRALNAAINTEAFAKSFREAYGKETEIIEEQEEELDLYKEYLEELKAKEEAGEFDGERGKQGDKGADGVITEIGYTAGFEIVNGELIVYYDCDENWSIDTEGHLILEYGE